MTGDVCGKSLILALVAVLMPASGVLAASPKQECLAAIERYNTNHKQYRAWNERCRIAQFDISRRVPDECNGLNPYCKRIKPELGVKWCSASAKVDKLAKDGAQKMERIIKTLSALEKGCRPKPVKLMVPSPRP
ncbi:MAG: hypothetical protein H6875_02565 [Hyphomicrobiaceae bacterium]|nr:hypothetical protein [Hyphomicrobiaceae bacterium]